MKVKRCDDGISFFVSSVRKGGLADRLGVLENDIIAQVGDTMLVHEGSLFGQVLDMKSFVKLLHNSVRRASCKLVVARRSDVDDIVDLT